MKHKKIDSEDNNSYLCA